MSDEWMADATCAQIGPTEWDADMADGRERTAMIRSAAETCHACPVLQSCARYALDIEATDGVWAGVILPGAERRSMLGRKRGYLERIAATGVPVALPPATRDKPVPIADQIAITVEMLSDGIPPADIAARLDCSMSALAKRLDRARRSDLGRVINRADMQRRRQDAA